MSDATAAPSDPLAMPLAVTCETEFERRVLTKFLELLRHSRTGAMIVALKESGLARFWANGQPAGVVK